jgi:hypothetical protein
MCPEICWNHARALCESCAPDLNENAASSQANVAVEQLQERARASDQTRGFDINSQPVAAAQQRSSARIAKPPWQRALASAAAAASPPRRQPADRAFARAAAPRWR